MRCINCGAEFGSKRNDAKFCSPKCKMQFIRNNGRGLSVTKDISVTDNSDNLVTDKLSVTKPVTDNLPIIETEEKHIPKEIVEPVKPEGLSSLQQALLGIRPGRVALVRCPKHGGYTKTCGCK